MQMNEPYPPLDIDAQMAKLGSPQTSLHARLERRAAWALIKHLEAQGWKPDAEIGSDEDTPTPDAKSIMELLFNLDEARFRFVKGNARGWVYLVRGNSPEELLSDYTTNLPLDDFDLEAAL